MVSVPSAFGAVILKAAALEADSRDPERQLQDAALLLCRIEDPYADRERFAGSDRRATGERPSSTTPADELRTTEAADS